MSGIDLTELASQMNEFRVQMKSLNGRQDKMDDRLKEVEEIVQGEVEDMAPIEVKIHTPAPNPAPNSCKNC